MKLKGLILFGILITSGVIHAQTDFRPGYIIQNAGDTVYGEIDYRGDLLMSSLCRFKDADNTIYEYSPTDIAAFRFIDSKYFVSREVNHKKVFLEYLIKGEVNMYYMRDDMGDHYYVDKEDVRLTKIPYTEGIKYIDGKQLLHESTIHVGLLNVFMQDAPGFQSRIEKIRKPTHQSLIQLAEDYHHAVCEDEDCIIYEKRLPLLKISITPFAGLTKYNGNDQFARELGGYLSLWVPRASEKLFFKTGVGFHSLSENGDKVNVIRIPFHIQYIFSAYRVQPNISAGASFLSFKADNNGFAGHTSSFSVGLDYRISDMVNLASAFQSDFNPLTVVIMNENVDFDILSYSIVIGLRIDL